VCAPSLGTTCRRHRRVNPIGNQHFRVGQPDTGEVWYAAVDRPLVNDRIHGSGGTMIGFAGSSNDLECSVERLLRVASGKDIDRSAGADEPLNNSVYGIPEQDGLIDNGPDFVVVKGVANVGLCRRFAVRNLHQDRPDVRNVSLGSPFLLLEQLRSPPIKVGDRRNRIWIDNRSLLLGARGV
jgi:hypothetical protein